MPTNVEIRPQEVFKTLESWKRWFMTMLLLMVLAMASSDVEASDPETMYRENQALTISVENIAAFYDSIEQVGEDEVAPINPEVENEGESFQVVIEADDNVRTLDNTAGLIRNYPRGNADVIGWFAATDDDSFGAVQRGYWLVIDNGGQLGAVFTGAVSETNGSMLTPRELADSNLPQFTFERGIPTPPAPEGDAEVEVAPTDDNTDGDEGVEVAMAPEGLVAPEVPSSFSVRTSEYNAANNTLIWVENTVTPTDDIMPLPFGIVNFNQYPQFGNFAQSIENAFRFGSATEMVDFRAMGIHAIYVKASGDGSGGFVYHFAIPQEGQSQDEWATFTTTTLPGSLAILPVNEVLQPIATDPNSLLVVDPNVRLGQNRLEVATNPVVPGDSLIVFVYDSQNDGGPAAEALGRICNGRNTEEQVELIMDGGVCTTLTGFDVSPRLTVGGIASPEN